jgi:hypothetical protein
LARISGGCCSGNLWKSGLPSFDRAAATQRVPSNWANTIISISVIGTARKAPGRPHRNVQNASASRVDDRVDVLRVGLHPRVDEIADEESDDLDPGEDGDACQGDGNCSSANRAGAIEPIVTPIIGMNDSRNSTTVQKKTLSSPTAASPAPRPSRASRR